MIGKRLWEPGKLPSSHKSCFTVFIGSLCPQAVRLIASRLVGRSLSH